MPLLWQIERFHAGFVCLLAGAAVWMLGPTVGASLLFGGALIWLNVWLFKQLFAVLIRRRPARRRLAIALLFAKLPLLWALLWLIAPAHLVAVDGVGLAAGITCFPLAVVVVALVRRSGAET